MVPRSSTPQYYKGCFTRGTSSKAKRDTHLSSTSSDTRETQICHQLRLIPERHKSVINFVSYPRDTHLSSTSSHTRETQICHQLRLIPEKRLNLKGYYAHGLILVLALVLFHAWFTFVISPSNYESKHTRG